MQGFYVSTEKKDDKQFEGLKTLLEEYKNTISTPGFWTRIFYNKHHLSYYSQGSDFIASNGAFIYKDFFNVKALQRFYEDLKSGSDIAKLLPEAHGQFFLVLYFNAKLMIITDRFRTLPVFLLRYGNCIEVSNIYYLLTRNANVNYSINFDYVAQCLSYPMKVAYVFTGATLFNEITYLDPGCIYSFTDKEIKRQQYYDMKQDIQPGRYKSLTQIVDSLTGIIEKNYRFIDNVENVFCGFTGGFDTRLNLSVMLNKKKKFICGNGILGHELYLRKGKYTDLTIVRKIAQEFNLDYRNICADEKAVEAWKEENRDFLRITAHVIGQPHRYYYYYVVSGLCDIELNGYGGSEFLTKDFYHYYSKMQRRFDVQEFLKGQKYNDILSDGYYNAKRYRKTLESHIHSLVEPITYQTRGQLYTYLLYENLFMNHLNDYCGTVNLYCPAYSPYFEPDFLKAMMESPYRLKGFHSIQRHLYRKIMDKRLRNYDTTHGYPTTTIDQTNFYRFGPLLNPIEPNLQYYPLLKRIKKEVLGFLMGTILPHVYFLAKRLGLERIGKLDSVNAYVKIIDESNPLNAYLDRHKLDKKVINARHRSAIKAYCEKMAVYLNK